MTWFFYVTYRSLYSGREAYKQTCIHENCSTDITLQYMTYSMTLHGVLKVLSPLQQCTLQCAVQNCNERNKLNRKSVPRLCGRPVLCTFFIVSIFYSIYFQSQRMQSRVSSKERAHHFSRTVCLHLAKADHSSSAIL